jgi:hypothetical protein
VNGWQDPEKWVTRVTAQDAEIQALKARVEELGLGNDAQRKRVKELEYDLRVSQEARVVDRERAAYIYESAIVALESQLTASRASEARMGEALKPLGRVQYFCFKCGGTTPEEMWRKAPVCSCGYCMVAIEPKKEIVAALDSSTALAWLAEQKAEAVREALQPAKHHDVEKYFEDEPIAIDTSVHDREVLEQAWERVDQLGKDGRDGPSSIKAAIMGRE